MPAHRRFFSQAALAQRKGSRANHRGPGERGRQGRTSWDGQLTEVKEVGPLVRVAEQEAATCWEFLSAVMAKEKVEAGPGWILAILLE